MAQNTVVEVGVEWVQLTNANADAITVSNHGSDSVELMGTTGTTAPSLGNPSAGIALEPEVGFINQTLAALFPGIAAVRLWARIPPNTASDLNQIARVFISHSDA